MAVFHENKLVILHGTIWFTNLFLWHFTFIRFQPKRMSNEKNIYIIIKVLLSKHNIWPNDTKLMLTIIYYEISTSLRLTIL